MRKNLIILIGFCLAYLAVCEFVYSGSEDVIVSTVDIEREYEVLGDVSVSKKGFIFPVTMKQLNSRLRAEALRNYKNTDAIIKVRYEPVTVASGVIDKVIGKTAKGQVVAFKNGKKKNKLWKTWGIYTSNLKGEGLKSIILDDYREMNHVRVSPDKEWITFSRFNTRSRNGLADEDGGYHNTEIMIMRLDGTGLESLTPPKKDVVNVNSYWTPDGRGLIYMSTDNPDKRKIRIKHIDLDTRKITNLTPEYISWVSDPQQVGEKLVFPATMDVDGARAIWSMDVNSKEIKQITYPQISYRKKPSEPPLGDADPKISPDQTKITFTRHFGNTNYHNMVIDLITGEEKDLSIANTIDVTPEWSSDGRLLAYWHVNMKNIRSIGLYTIKPDGTDKTMIPLPFGHHWKMPAFFPGEGSDDNTRIIFTGKTPPETLRLLNR